MDEGFIKGGKVCHHTEGRVILERSFFYSVNKSVLRNDLTDAHLRIQYIICIEDDVGL